MEKSFMFTKVSIPYGKEGKTLDFKNRYQIPPMCSWVAEEGIANGFHHGRYQSFAMGGFGSIIFEATGVEAEGRITNGCLGLWNDEQEKSLKSIVSHLHQDYYKGVKVGIQLAHAGRKSSSGMPWLGFKHIKEVDGGFASKSCSPLKHRETNQEVHELTNKEVKEMVQKFVNSAVRAKRAGFDFIEIHGAHGYLITQFLCNSSNIRKDEYGGSFENRTRFLMEIVEGIFKKIGDFPVFVRLSPREDEKKLKVGDEENNKKAKEFNKTRWKMEDTIKLVKKLQKAGVCLIDCSSLSVADEETKLKFSEVVKKELGDKIKTSCVGMIYESSQCEQLIKEKVADVVQLGKQALMNPYTPISHARDLKFSYEDYSKLFCIQHGFAIERLSYRKPLYDLGNKAN